MKRHLSVLSLAARSTIYKVLGLFAVMSAVEVVLFSFALQKTLQGEPIGFEQMINQSGIVIVCGICFILLCALLSLTGCEYGGGKLRYTVRRLSVREDAIVFWWAGYNAAIFLLFWVAQIAVGLLLGKLFITQMDPAYVSDQTIFLAFYRNSFLHSLLPLDEISRYIRNIVFILSLGVCASGFSFRQRHGEKGTAMVVLAVVVAVAFPKKMGGFGSDMLLVIVGLCFATYEVFGIYKERSDDN